MSFRLDGIETAMEATEEVRTHGFELEVVTCPCSWRCELYTDADHAALRFHYTFCPKAKKACEHEQVEDGCCTECGRDVMAFGDEA